MPHCLQCSAAFVITESELAFLDKVSPVFNGKKELIPPPSLCPKCRRQRRFAFRNERTLYHRKCDLSGKQIISNYATDASHPVYAHDEWWSDRWDGRTYGRDVDFSKSFFTQYAALQNDVPQLALSVWNSENSDYCNYVGNVQDSYLIFGSVYSQDCYYGSPYYSKNSVDTLVVRDCELCYECVDCRKLHHCLYCQDCHTSNDLLFCFDCQGCSDCIGCAGLRNKKYCIFNEQWTPEEFNAKKKSLDLCEPAVRKLLRQQLDELKRLVPHRYMQSAQTEQVSGNYIYQCRNVLDSYYTDRSQDCRHCAQVVDLKDCMDINFTEENELCYEYLGSYQNHHLLFSRFCNRVTESMYCDSCFGSHHLFGCIGLRNAEYCILNRQYSQEEYDTLASKLIEHMRMTPLRLPDGSFAGQEWGDNFPVSISPFGYNETVAQEYHPLTEKEVRAYGWRWRQEDLPQEKYLGPDTVIPANITDVPEEITKQILKCEVTGKPYKIIPQELKFYRDMGIPIPRKCPDQRHKERMTLRNPRKLWSRECMKCGKDIQTTYAPERPEKVLCESCYLAVVY